MKKEQPTLHCIGLTHKLSYHGQPVCCRSVFRLLPTSQEQSSHWSGGASWMCAPHLSIPLHG